MALWLAQLTDEALAGDSAPRSCAVSASRCRNSTCASVGRCTSAKRSSASAATAMRRTGGWRLFRESPLSSIWEGTGNVATRRTAGDRPPARDARDTVRRLDAVGGSDAHLDAYVGALKQRLGDLDDIEYRARGLGEVRWRWRCRDVAGALRSPGGRRRLLRLAPRRRLGTVHGTPRGIDTATIIDRATVKV